ncbi:MAG: S-layer homology domain-containing protein, partial [Acidimicrobiales bacterium]|nr:S-layer homology domain-containing protein [Acidimicrobiales bacterium]
PDGRFYSEPVQWAFDNGVTTGTSATTFSPDDPVTRGQNVTFMYRHQKQVIDPLLNDIRTDVNTAQTDADTAQTTADANAGELAGLGDRVDALGRSVPLLQWSNSATITIDVGNIPSGVAFDGTHIWTANYGDGTVSKIVAATGAVEDTITVGDFPYGVAFDGTHIWVANLGDDTVSKIVAATGVVAAPITVGDGPYGVAFDGTHIWVTNVLDDTVSKIPVG